MMRTLSGLWRGGKSWTQLTYAHMHSHTCTIRASQETSQTSKQPLCIHGCENFSLEIRRMPVHGRKVWCTHQMLAPEGAGSRPTQPSEIRFPTAQVGGCNRSIPWGVPEENRLPTTLCSIKTPWRSAAGGERMRKCSAVMLMGDRVQELLTAGGHGHLCTPGMKPIQDARI